MSRRVIYVELDGHNSLLSGYGSRELYEEIVGRPPMWVSTMRGWSCQESTARNVIAAAERAGYDVVITGPRTRKQRLYEALDVAPAPRFPDCPDIGTVEPTPHRRAPRREQADPGSGLW